MTSISGLHISMEKSVDFMDTVKMMSIAELKVAIDDENQVNALLKLENMLLETYLRQNYAHSLGNMNAALEESQRRLSTSREQSMSGTFSLRTSSSESSSSQIVSYDPSEPRTGSFVRACLSFRTGLVQKAIDQKEIELERQLHIWKQQKRNMCQEFEQFETLAEYIDENIETFNKGVHGAFNHVTGRYEGDKVVLIIENFLRAIDLKIDNARLQLACLHIRNRKIKSHLAEKGELGERIYPIDFDIMHINQKEMLKKLELRNVELLEVKKIAAETVYILGLQKKFLLNQLKDVEATKRAISNTKRKIGDFSRLQWQVMREEQKAYNALRKVRYMKTNFNTPPLSDYIDKRCELQELNKQIKIWNRRKQLVHVQLQGARLQLKKATGISKLQKVSSRQLHLENMTVLFKNMDKDLTRLESKIFL